MSDNHIELNYLYRDTSNYKAHAQVVFANPRRVSVDKICSELRSLLSESSPFPDMLHFHPERVGLETVFLCAIYGPSADDVDFHEIGEIIETDEPVSDPQGRSIDSFLDDLNKTHNLSYT